MSLPRIALQGIAGSFHHQAALKLFPGGVQVVECRYFDQVPQAVTTGKADYGLMAIENSTAGSILPNYALIDASDLQILREVYVDVRHQLMALPGTELQHIESVWSHPMALLQCGRFLRQHPGWQRIEYEDTAAAARDIAQRRLKGTAAIAPKIAAELYGLEILAADIQDQNSNATRFVLLGTPVPPQAGADKVSLRIETPHRPGALLEILEILAHYRWNMTKLQSLPIPQRPWEYRFFIDAVFPEAGSFDRVIELLRQKSSHLKILGIYPNQNL